jgi:hypothetical protein
VPAVVVLIQPSVVELLEVQSSAVGRVEERACLELGASLAEGVV